MSPVLGKVAILWLVRSQTQLYCQLKHRPLHSKSSWAEKILKKFYHISLCEENWLSQQFSKKLFQISCLKIGFIMSWMDLAEAKTMYYVYLLDMYNKKSCKKCFMFMPSQKLVWFGNCLWLPNLKHALCCLTGSAQPGDPNGVYYIHGPVTHINLYIEWPLFYIVCSPFAAPHIYFRFPIPFLF